MEDDSTPMRMTPDELVTVMLNAQRETARQIATIQRDQAQQQQQFTQMLQTLTSAIQNQPVPVVAAPTPGPTPQPAPVLTSSKIPLPDAYDRTRQGAEPFLSGLHLVFHSVPTQYTMDDSKVALALSLMKGGTAGPWASSAIEEIRNHHRNPTTPTPFADWAQFETKFATMFSDPDPAATALRRVESMRQGTRTVDEYVTEFRTWQHRSQLNDQALSNYFCAGLNTEVLKAILGFQTVPDTLQTWQDQAMTYDRRMRMFRDKNHTTTAWRARHTHTHQAHVPLAPATSSRDPNAMDIDSTCTRRPVVCYNCRAEGHFARNCPTRADAPRVSRQNIREMTNDDFLQVIAEELKSRDITGG